MIELVVREQHQEQLLERTLEAVRLQEDLAKLIVIRKGEIAMEEVIQIKLLVAPVQLQHRIDGSSEEIIIVVMRLEKHLLDLRPQILV